MSSAIICVEHVQVWIEFGRIKLPTGLHPNDLEETWGKLILEMLEREKALRPAVDRLELLLQVANKIQNAALDCEEKLTLAKNTLQAVRVCVCLCVSVTHKNVSVAYKNI